MTHWLGESRPTQSSWRAGLYVIEWVVVVGASLVSGFMLWSTMIRRRLHREVRTTRITGD
jgi:hypothetical protein